MCPLRWSSGGGTEPSWAMLIKLDFILIVDLEMSFQTTSDVIVSFDDKNTVNLNVIPGETNVLISCLHQ